MSGCVRCGALGVPYEYRGRSFDGLVSVEGARLCPPCARGALRPPVVAESVGLHGPWLHEPEQDRAPLLPFALAGEVRRVMSPDRRYGRPPATG